MSALMGPGRKVQSWESDWMVRAHPHPAMVEEPSGFSIAKISVLVSFTLAAQYCTV